MPIPPATSDDLSRDAFLVGLSCNGYKRVEPALIAELLAHPLPPYVKAGAHAVVHSPSPDLIALLVATYEARRRAALDAQNPDNSLATMLASLSAMQQNLPEIYLAAATEPTDEMLTTTGLLALAQLNHPATASLAKRLLDDPRQFVRSTAASVLARIAPDTAFDDLLAQLNNHQLDARTIAQTISALLNTNNNAAATCAYEYLKEKPDDLKVVCAYDLAIRRPSGAGRLVSQLYTEMKSESHRVSMLKAMGTLGDSDAESCMFEALRHGSSAEVIAVVDRLAGYEPRVGWHDDLRAAAKQRGDVLIIARIEERITKARERDEMR